MRLTAHALTKAADPLTTWLASLKATQLKTVARATGIRNPGRKDVLSARLRTELMRSVFLPNIPPTHIHDKHDDNKTNSLLHPGNDSRVNLEQNDGDSLSILSIDMGIQNLAFAHLLVRPAKAETDTGDYYEGHTTTLNAWHRIGVQELSAITPLHSATTIAAIPTGQTQNDDSIGEHSSKRERSFDPDILAGNAYTLLSSLISAYNPTHILIERQRFRSGGRSAVLEWTLRVGVFEGMLHAVLHTMQQLGRCPATVYGVSPARVSQYWGGAKEGGDDSKDGQKSIKRMKIDLVGEWLDQGSSSSFPSKSRPRISIPSAKPSDVQTVVAAYLERWSGQRSKAAWRIEKLDDLADCLLQGLTWLEWQDRRAQFAKDGVEALRRVEMSLASDKNKH
ncbi:mitochondrial resolvase Ydc2 [Talaromyces proteolyticus]|uniref:Mitochondrial resolvase Ydc2 n=1 Tax=Talaromyces proteolyticus TaxID=1131652 RepID=A0AAD4KQM3_9EURO|nr:mitochondrial resolvase Ydc2 [Talaromyces proteolyticus]KAH8697189.1 mitochondrial resolvase Ydc2 [Talaromyces proteolyticus]